MDNTTRYSEYTPDLSSLNDLPRSEELVSQQESAQSNSKSNGRRVKNKKPAKGKDRKPVTQAPKMSWFANLYNALTGSTARVLFGIFLMCVAVYLAVSFISYFTTCVVDQSLVNSNPMGSIPNVRNAGGEGGARLAEFLINECFGLGSFVIIVWLFCISLKLLVGHPRFKIVNFTIKCIIALITISLVVGLATITAHSPVNWGGYHGRYVNEFIYGFFGWSGASLLSLFMVAVFIMICLRDVVKWIVKKIQEHREKRRAEFAARREQEAREAELRKMQQEEELEDIRAGESTMIQSDVTDVNDMETRMEFANNDAPLYSVDSEIDDVEIDTHHPLFKASGDNENVVSSGADEIRDYVDSGESKNSIESKESEDEENSEKLSETDESSEVDERAMTVNVNTIGQSGERHFKSEVEMYEATPYKFPPYDLLRQGNPRVDVSTEEQLANQATIEKTLLDFNIPITRISATVGPTITLYEIVPDSGVTIAKIRRLVDDIALSLAAVGVRIIAPIPGKGTVGIEVANKNPQTVSMRTVIQSNKYQESKYKLPLALGSTISNDVYIADLAKMPHLLVAGATGQGKSVGLNAMIASLLYCKAPWQLKFVLIDPKQVEFSLYNKLKNYYMAVLPGEELEESVITDMKKVEAVLNSLCIEMDNRYTLLKEAGVRNIEEYNEKLRDGLLNPADGHRFLPYIVVVVDEFGDLIMVLGKGVEMPIARLAQKARAVGMHVIIATQRPSANVITGIIKANFPARMAFKVASGVDSKTILDTPGAQQLVGRGDMLIFHESEMVRVQCAFIDTPEVEAIVDYISRRPYPTGPYILPEPILPGDDDAKGDDSGGLTDRDPLFDDVARAIVNGRTASTSSIQRHYSIGYTRAARIVDQLERAGIVGPNQGGKPRAVLVDLMELEKILSSF